MKKISKNLTGKTRLQITFAIFILLFSGCISDVPMSDSHKSDEALNAGGTTCTTIAYVVNTNSDDISAYCVETSSGALNSIDADSTTAGIQNFSTGDRPTSITVDPNGKFAYVTNSNVASVSAYTVNASGTLSAIDADTGVAGIQNFNTGANPDHVEIDPNGKFIYVANQNSGSISAFTIDSVTGFLSAIDADSGTAGIQNFAAGGSPQSVAIDPSGKFLYVANAISNDFSAYTINNINGVLTQIDADTGTAGIQNYPGGGNPVAISVDPLGKYVYATGVGTNIMYAFSINNIDGTLTAVPGSPFATVTFGNSVVIDPQSKFVYAAVNSGVSAFTINDVSGAITAIDADTGAIGIQPFRTPINNFGQSVDIDPTGKYLYMANKFVGIAAFSINNTTGFLTHVDADADTAGFQNNAPGGAGYFVHVFSK